MRTEDRRDSSPKGLAARGRFTEIRESVYRRLRPICAHMPDDQFDELCDRITRTQFRFEQHPGLGGPPPSR